MFAKYKNIIIVVIIIIVGFLLYSIIKPDPEEKSLLNSSGPQQAKVLGEDIIRALNEIDDLVLDSSILEDQIIKSLTDHGRPITEEPLRGNNPFAPSDDIGTVDANGGIEEDAVVDEDLTL